MATDAPIEAYQQRAANTSQPSKPPGLVRRALHRTVYGLRAAISGVTFHADISYYQRVVNGTYPYPVICIRGHSGGMIDPNLHANWSVLVGMSRVQLVVVYVVYIPGRNQEIVAGVKSVLGARCPAKVVFRVDMESGQGFAGPGNHSADANQLVAMLTAYRATAVGGNLARARLGVDGYANQWDWAANWPQHGNIKRDVAGYSSSPPPTPWYSWQYYGGDPRWSSPSGYPRSCAPFGSHVDMNVTPKRIGQILIDYGVTAPAPPDPSQEVIMLQMTQAELDKRIDDAIVNAMRVHVGYAKKSGRFSAVVNKVWAGRHK